ncbi:MAG: DegT/DnrJ/EryC1/StrS family aminotransferase, partial [Oligoflexia bacterium]|nr:DegT/DnrJ/EryC1/StrS family aminotransferase [Oligoflexia bacterium]
GAILTNNFNYASILKTLRSHGIIKDNFMNTDCEKGDWYYEMQYLGYNYRLTDIQCALGISQLKKIDYFIKRRRFIFERYYNAFKNHPIITIQPPIEGHAYHLAVILIDFRKLGISRGEVMKQLRSKNIGTQVHYIPIYRQPVYKELFNYKISDFPHMENYYEKSLSIPLYPKMSDQEIDYVIETIKNYTL